MSTKSSKDTIITPEFSGAFEVLENTSDNVLLTGNAGTGKSTFLDYFRNNSKKNIAVVAPTGVAALNVRGQTIHSLFRFKTGFLERPNIRPYRRDLFRELDLLIIDEVSMVRADVFDAIEYFLRITRKNSEPFGGLQICLIGDLFQLPPVVTREEHEFFAQYYTSPFFFNTEAYQLGKFQLVQFTQIHRQDDDGFINLLNAIRHGSTSTEELELLNSRYKPKAVPAPGTLVLTTTNYLAEQINRNQLARLSGDSHTFTGEMTSKFSLKGGRLPAPDPLELKLGAQVMFVKNDPDGRWVNGTIGIIESLDKKQITVKVKDITYHLKPEKWQTIAYEYDEDKDKIVEKVVGSYTQFPLQLAWAITIHKSQGKTLDRVIINLGSGAFAAGQLYVALSRCRSLTGIALKQAVNPSDIQCDPEIVEFMSEQEE